MESISKSIYARLLKEVFLIQTLEKSSTTETESVNTDIFQLSAKNEVDSKAEKLFIYFIESIILRSNIYLSISLSKLRLSFKNVKSL